MRDTPAPAGCVNPYDVHVPGVDAFAGASAQRTAQLEAYLAHRVDTARVLLVAEAPGYQGARFSGIAMTCERTLAGQKEGVPLSAVFGDSFTPRRTSDPAVARNAPERAHGFSEPTASIVWRELVAHDATRAAVLWNVFPYHPCKPGQPLTNRTPTPAEVAARMELLHAFLAVFQGRQIIAIGNTARDHLAQAGLTAPAVRHPANGGAGKFRAGLREILATAG
ncbi:uracil-DNA glycosylase [Mesobacterium pallidum]|uniref:uracil-DNA glycosylase n=1 Tax=Mesobacterium pallidum TaxID=2872037 RepID=UPI001EE269B0|nr:uracil-DNA glycosylase [Mesobacterium pallidum]